MFVGSRLPHGLEIEHGGETIILNGANVGYDANNPWRSGAAPDSLDRVSGAGLTLLEGKQADAFMEWFELSGKGSGPVKNGQIFITDKKADAAKEAQSLEGETTGADPVDPSKDLPKGVETDTEKKG